MIVFKMGIYSAREIQRGFQQDKVSDFSPPHRTGLAGFAIQYESAFNPMSPDCDFGWHGLEHHLDMVGIVRMWRVTSAAQLLASGKRTLALGVGFLRHVWHIL